MDFDIDHWTGGTVWDSSTVLSQYLCTFAADYWPGRRVLELGCGCGLVGLTAARLGAAECCLTDVVLHVARHNADTNFSGAERERVRLQQLRWGDEKQIAAAGTHDLILGSDILYHTGSYPALADTLAGLAHPGTVALLATPDEAFALKLFDRMRGHGFLVEDISAGETVVAGLIAEMSSKVAYSGRGPVSVIRATMGQQGARL